MVTIFRTSLDFSSNKPKIRYFYSLFLGSFTTLTLPPFFFLPIIFLTFPLFFRLITSSKNKLEAYLIGFFFGIGHFTTGLYWISNSLFFDISQFWFLVPFALFGIPAAISLIYIGPLALITYMLKMHNLPKIIFFSCLWVVFEWIRAHLFTGFPWNLVGYSLCVSNELIQLSSITGIYGLSFVVVFSGTIMFLIFQNRKNLKYVLSAIFIIYTTLFLFGKNRIETAELSHIEDIKLKIIQANIKQELSLNQKTIIANFNKYIELSNRGDEVPDIVVWPEGSFPLLVDAKNPIEAFQGLIKVSRAVIIGTDRGERQNDVFKIWNSAMAINNNGIVIDYYDKIHLVPFGEYIPFRSLLSFHKIANGMQDFTKGESAKSIDIGGTIPRFAAMICYESIFPDHPMVKGEKAAKWILNITNDAWFGNSTGPYQHFHKARIRAVEQGIPLVRSAVTGISGVIDSFGRVETLLELNKEGVIYHYLPPSIKNETLYSKYGDFIIFALVIVTFILGLAINSRNRSLQKDNC